MASPEVDRPAVVAEVAACFAAYEDALVAGDAATLDGYFWSSPLTVRFGVADRQRSAEEIARWRRGQGPLRGRRLAGTIVTAFGDDTAVVTTLFTYPDHVAAPGGPAPGAPASQRPVEGRQTQVWVRMAEGWRIVSAHVSHVARDANPPDE